MGIIRLKTYRTYYVTDNFILFFDSTGLRTMRSRNLEEYTLADIPIGISTPRKTVNYTK